MLKRTLTGGALLCVLLGAWWLDNARAGGPAWALAGLGVLLSFGCLRELLAMGGAAARQRHVGLIAGGAWLALLVAAGAAPALGLDQAEPLLARVGDVLAAASALASLLLLVELPRGPGRPALRLARSLWFVVPYAGGVACLLPLLLEGRLAFVIGIVLTSKSSDIGAYFTGKLFGRHKLAPAISPGKTIEGLIGGLLLPAVVGTLLLEGAVIAEHEGVGRALPGGAWGAAVHGLVIAVLTVLSDLGESLLKRSCSVKDSGTLFGEAGGFLDLADSLLLVAPLTLAYTAIAT